MCRFILYLGTEITLSSLVTEPVNSIIHQSFHSHEREEPLNGDGFGLAWYVPEITEEPVLFKDVTPAWNNLNLLNLSRVTRSSCVLAHVRAASPGLPVIQPNCHPFSWGPFAFMHNGRVAGFRKVRRVLLERLSTEAFHLISGSTDSEHVFALFVDHYRRLSQEQNRAEAMAMALTATIGEVEELTRQIQAEEPSLLNIAVTDGDCAVVTRYISCKPEKGNTLYIHTGRRYVCDDGHCQMVEPADGRGAVIIASEPLSKDEGWMSVQPNSLVVVQKDLQLDIRALEI